MQPGSGLSRLCGVAALTLLVMVPAVAADARQTLRLAIEESISRTTGQLAGRIEVEVGSIPNGERLAACAHPEPYMPTGARAWGRSVVGIRCRDGAEWNVLVPVNVRVFGMAIRASSALSMNATLGEADVRFDEVDLTRERPGLLADMGEATGKVLARPVTEGTILRRDHFRLPMAVVQGDAVKIVHRGAGFTVAVSGRALQSAGLGQPVRIQSESGRTMTGIAREGRVVEVSL